ncbi:MAG: hypothetical protein GY952_01520 [Rhodobacteraceae bacterium]|nr:hypothetical protein [Paracoccaceae bacterium]
MYNQSLESFLNASGGSSLPKGPVALIFAEDDVGTGACIRHHARLGFPNILVMADADLSLPEDCQAMCHQVISELPVNEVVNKAIEAFAGRWLYYCYNAEFLHFPFCEDRSIEEMIAFVTEERRQSVFTYVVDLYTDDLEANPYGYSLESAHLDVSGYYALKRWRDGSFKDRQLDIFGGLKWRFEEHLPALKRRIDRVSLFQAQKGLQMDADYLFNEDEYNTYQCPWHHSTTVAVCSFRTAKYLKSNPGSTFEIDTFKWAKSEKFHWNSRQLMDLGLMEPGQWL